MEDPDFSRESRRYESPIASRRYILQTMASIGEPAGFERISSVLGLDQHWQQDALRKRLRAMVRDGQLLVNRRNVYAIASKMELVRGRVEGHVDGYGFLIPDAGEKDIFLGHRQMRGVFHGDIVLVRVRGKDRRGRPEGEIVEVLDRKTTQMMGRLYFENRTWFLESLNNRVCQEILVLPHDQLVEGRIVLARIVDQPTRHGLPSCAVEEVFGEHLTPDMEIKISLSNHNIPEMFSTEDMIAADALPEEVIQEDKLQRADLRDLSFVTIDGPDARDFDDAIFCEELNRGGWKLYVAVADVAHYVRQDSVLDQTALERGTSVYFPQHVVPMLPGKLSNGLCSLKPDVDRLVLVCEMSISEHGSIDSYQFYEGLIRSAARLTYAQVACGETGGSWQDSLAHADKLLSVLLSVRAQRGALDFDSTELAFAFDSTGAVDSISRQFRNRAHHLIEECMLCANVCAARFMDSLGIAGLYRVHRRPESEKTDYLRIYLNSVGISLPEGIPTPSEFQHALNILRSKPNGHILQIAVLRALSQAVYQVKNEGHFGLNYPMYTHFTSPIRRYPDLLTHRLIKSVIHSRKKTDLVRRFGAPSKPEYDCEPDRLHALGNQCSRTERRAETAVYEILEWMKCEYMDGKVGDIEPGVIIGVTGFGLFIELSDVLIEGLVHVSTLIDDYYHFDQGEQRLVGEKNGLVFGIGDNVSVQVARVSVDERKIDFELISHDPLEHRPRTSPGKTITRKGRSAESGIQRNKKSSRRRHRSQAS